MKSQIEKMMVMGWWRYATNNGDRGSTHWYLLPFDATPGPLFNPSKETVEKILRHRVCAPTFMQVLQRKRSFMESIRQQALSCGVPKQHGNIGKKGKRIDDEHELYENVKNTFEEVIPFATVRATRAVAKLVRDEERVMVNRDDDEDDVRYLPPHMGLCPLYARYMKKLDYRLVPLGNGNTTPEWRGNGVPRKYFSLTTFRNIWEREYSWLKVSGRAEDICSECFMFANRHKFLADHAGKYVGATLRGDGENDNECNDEQYTLNSAADSALFH